MKFYKRAKKAITNSETDVSFWENGSKVFIFFKGRILNKFNWITDKKDEV